MKTTKLLMCGVFLAATLMSSKVRARDAWFDDNGCQIEQQECSWAEGSCWGGDNWPDNCYDPEFYYEFLNWCADYCNLAISYVGTDLTGCSWHCQCESCPD